MIRSISSTNRLHKVLFPAPDGADTTIISGRDGRGSDGVSSISSLLRDDSIATFSCINLFNVLNLLANALKLGFEGDHVPGDFHFVGLGTNGVDLTKKLLAQEVERAANRLGRTQ